MSPILHPATRYTPCPDLWCVTAYFNPAHYRTRRANYETFVAPLRAAGIHLLTVECAFGDDPFDLPPGPEVLQVRGRDVLWQQKRLINLGVSRLPPQATKVAWLDGDILFANPDWAAQTVSLLDRFPVVQLFDSCVSLEPGQNSNTGFAPIEHSFAHVWQQWPGSILGGFTKVGAPGYAWAARRSLITKHGLYDMEVVGGGDARFAFALVGGFRSRLVRMKTVAKITPFPIVLSILLRFLRRVLGFKWLFRRHGTGISFAHYVKWARGLYREVHGRIGCVSGAALHLWHGDHADRQYQTRYDILKQNGFDPAMDIRLNAQGIWEWSSAKPALHQAVRDYFYTRREDG